MENKKAGFIAFLLGLFVGRYGIPAVIHVFYLSVILALIMVIVRHG